MVKRRQRKKLIQRVINHSYHRNGNDGKGFDVVLFQDGSNDDRATLVGIVFEEPGHCAVLDVNLLAAGNVMFGENSWRGDQYERELREAIATNGDTHAHASP